MWIGCTLTERILEVGVEYMSNDIEHIYHARKAQKETIRKAVNRE
jgi:hypothetical protein